MVVALPGINVSEFSLFAENMEKAELLTKSLLASRQIIRVLGGMSDIFAT
jgi:hypothetical protein